MLCLLRKGIRTAVKWVLPVQTNPLLILTMRQHNYLKHLPVVQDVVIASEATDLSTIDTMQRQLNTYAIMNL